MVRPLHAHIINSHGRHQQQHHANDDDDDEDDVHHATVCPNERQRARKKNSFWHQESKMAGSARVISHIVMA